METNFCSLILKEVDDSTSDFKDSSSSSSCLWEKMELESECVDLTLGDKEKEVKNFNRVAQF